VRVLVTGGAGFIGSHILERLIERGDVTIALDDLSTGSRANVPSRVELAIADISDPGTLERSLHGRFDAVVHAAAEARVTVSVADPARSARINVQGTEHVIALARQRGAGRFVFISTGGAIYGETPVCATEEAELRPISPYGRHKMEAEAIVRASGLPHAILRLGNVYGPRQRGDLEAGVIAIFIQRHREGKELVVFGDGSAERDYVYVADVVDCVVAALDRSDDGTWNVGTGVATSVNGIIDALSHRLGPPTRGVRYAPPRPGELQRSCLDPSKAARDGLWRPRYRLDHGLRALLER
jgi:UDP-glucose 4-epimerase